jgi:hypothetical protein
MPNQRDISRDKSLSDLGREASWFITHTVVAFLLLVLVVGVIALNHPDPDSSSPKMLGTVLAFLVPMFGGFVLARIYRNDIASYVWISGLVIFSITCVWVLDLPTGNGLCENCGAVEKLWRTFFTLNHGSGLMAGDGLLVGTWTPLSMIGYAVGAKFAIEP